MGRSLKRVPLDFRWPLNKIWEGYLCPINPPKCPDCKLGWSKHGQFLEDSFYYHNQYELWANWVGHPVATMMPAAELLRRGFSQEIVDNIEMARFFKFESLVSWRHRLDKEDVKALVKEGRLMDFTHRWTKEKGWVKKKPLVLPDPEVVNKWDASGMGHDSINAGILVKYRCKRYGVPHRCKTCKGSAQLWASREDQKRYDAWEPVEPPKGEGFQLWETTSEGSPISPVFASLDELCAWCETNATTFGDARASAAQWKEMLQKDFVHHQMGNVVLI